MTTAISRRTLAKGAAWSAPVVVASAAIPAYAASTPRETSQPIDYGIFVTATAMNTGSYFGYDGTLNSGVAGPNVVDSFRNGDTWYENDLRWTDGSGPVSGAESYWNGEGSFTPGGVASSNGNYYNTRTGFWVSTPTTAPGTGTGYNGSVTLARGAQFSTVFTYTIPAGADFVYPTIFNRNTPWNTAITGKKLVRLGPATSTTLAVAGLASDLTFSEPQVVQNADGSTTFTGVITTTTTEAFTATNGKFIQTLLLPAILVYSPTYSNLSITSSVTSASVTYTPSGGRATNLTITGETTTSAIHP